MIINILCHEENERMTTKMFRCLKICTFFLNLIKSKKDFCCCLSDLGIHTDNKLKSFTQRFGTDKIYSYCNMDLI